jgi:hypothetical protein
VLRIKPFKFRQPFSFFLIIPLLHYSITPAFLSSFYSSCKKFPNGWIFGFRKQLLGISIRRHRPGLYIEIDGVVPDGENAR